MTHRLTRGELHRLVWSAPMKQLAMRFAISDVALAKACRRAHIPLPERGYWAKQKIGKGRRPEPLPLRFPGMSDEIIVGGGSSWSDWRYGSNEEELREPLPPPPAFPEETSAVRERVRQMVGKVRGSSTFDQPHPLIARLLEADERRREKQKNAAYAYSWDNPIFDAPIERRRLRILNALFHAVERCPCKPSIRGREGRELGIQVGQQYVRFTLDLVQARRPTVPRDGREVNREDKRLRFELQGFDRQKGCGSWEDDGVETLEKRIEEIAVELIVAGECQHRESARRHYDWRVRRKVELEREAQQKKAQQERLERERQIQIERERVERLLAEASALRKANEIRGYVDAIRNAEVYCEALELDVVNAWANWALNQADRIDPIKTRIWLKSYSEGMQGKYK